MWGALDPRGKQFAGKTRTVLPSPPLYVHTLACACAINEKEYPYNRGVSIIIRIQVNYSFAKETIINRREVNE